MTLSLILPMSMFALAASISPGPVNLVCLGSGLHQPPQRGLRFVTGATLGFVVLFMAIGLGLYGLLQAHPALMRTLHWAGIGFLLYMSLRLATASGSLPMPGSGQAPGLLAGALMQWLNPKAWLASASGIAAYTDGGLNQIGLFALLYLPICWCSLACWLWLGSRLRRHLHNTRWLVLLNRLLALLLAASCLYLLRY
ncbi:lysine exporter protein LysE/YggA [Oceanimonas sp. GK1]|uniref:LysE family translocator n=1 Tax=Oceanimonas sp. (strain GK1 / IBRC-M 10197) TaxID=511062 RepID=UPI00024952EC|nr:LysE family translocator [Oceanimonas sp. GK1]AEY01894.1 lysine exporter protein LysE/YggA [Oceanimonas sp. GK1]